MRASKNLGSGIHHDRIGALRRPPGSLERMRDLARARPESFFADRFNVTSSLLDRVLGTNLLGKVDDADIYLEYCINEELQLEESTVKKASRHVSQGAGSPPRAPGAGRRARDS